MSIHFPQDWLAAFRLIADVVAKEVRHLDITRRRLFVGTIDAGWVRALDENADLSERVEAFASRFGRLQDTLGEKLLPRMAALVGQRPASLVELLLQAEKFGWIESADRWLEWRKLRNRLVHGYIADPEEFAQALNAASLASAELLTAEARIREHDIRIGLLPIN